MLEAMRRLALDMLCIELGGPAALDPESWYRELRKRDPGRLFPWLVESAEKIERYYTLCADPIDSNTAIFEVHDFKPGDAQRLPFNQPSGSQAAALGPVIKRTWRASNKTAGPTVKIQTTTLNAFRAIAQEEREWSSYFGEALACLERSRVKLAWSGDTIEGESGEAAFLLSIRAIPEKKTVILAFKDSKQRLPGEVPEYIVYLQSVFERTKYTTLKAPAQFRQQCPLCDVYGVVFPNAVSGSGINLSNMDRIGAFPGVDIDAAWKGFALCGACADLLYIYKNYVAEDFRASIAGDRALVIPLTQIDLSLRRRFTRRIKDFAKGAGRDEVAIREERLMRLLGDDVAVTSLTFLWANFGQSIDDIRGIVTDILPSRLRQIDEMNQSLVAMRNPVFPTVPLDGFHYDLRLSILRELLKRPGGKKVTAINAGKRLFDLRRDLAAAIYHGRDVDYRRFWSEVLMTARCHLNSVAESGNAWGLLHEGFSEKKRVAFLTFAGWIRHLSMFLHYLRMTGVMPMPGELYQPRAETLKPYFTAESAIDSPEKAFAFILGALYGKVMQVQAARGVNVGANALTWLKRLTLTGRDLPELYVKVREKLLAYETEGNPAVREITTELGHLGAKIGHESSLDDVQTCYYLLLGQSLATTIMPSKSNQDAKGVG